MSNVECTAYQDVSHHQPERKRRALTEHEEGFHVLYRDFYRICCRDTVNANALRAIEVMSNHRLNYLVERYNIPDGYDPDPDDMWIEPSLRDIERITVEAQGRSSYARALAPHRPEGAMPSLVQMGYVDYRLIARCGYSGGPVAVPTTIFRDEKGFFIVVENRNGLYRGDDGELHCGRAEGYSQIVTQYRYCADVVNHKIAEGAWKDPPQEKRYYPPIVKRAPKAQAAKPTEGAAQNDTLQQTSAKEEAHREGTTPSSESSFRKQNITTSPGMSMEVGAVDTPTSQGSVPESTQDALIGRLFTMMEAILAEFAQIKAASDRNTTLSKYGQPRPSMDRGVQSRTAVSTVGHIKNKNKRENQQNTKKESAQAPLSSFPLFSDQVDFDELRTAEWCAETLVALASAVLPIPDPASMDAQTWQSDYIEPAIWLIAALDGIDPRRAWEKIERQIRGMIEGPTWYATKRSRSSPISLRHVVGTNKATGQLTGFNWRVVGAELDRASWYPSEQTPYDGPMGSYELGYAGVDTTAQAEPAEEEPRTDELPAVQQRGMSADEAYAVAQQIHADYPTISTAYAEVAPGLFYVGIEYGPDQWINVKRTGQWEDRPPRIQAKIDQAVQFGAQCAGMAEQQGRQI